MKNCVLDETRHWIAFQLLCMHACGLLSLYLFHSSGPWKVDILFCTATVLLNPFPPVKPHLSHSLFSQSTPPPPILLPVKGGQSLAIHWQKNTVSDWCK